MNRRNFWQIPEFVKFRTVFENAETVLGVNETGARRLFRKDTGQVCFDEREALQRCLASLVVAETVDIMSERKEVVCV